MRCCEPLLLVPLFLSKEAMQMTTISLTMAYNEQLAMLVPPTAMSADAASPSRFVAFFKASFAGSRSAVASSLSVESFVCVFVGAVGGRLAFAALSGGANSDSSDDVSSECLVTQSGVVVGSNAHGPTPFAQVMAEFCFCQILVRKRERVANVF